MFHMVTAADGAEKYYTLANNAARSENAEEACRLDKRLQECWLGHHNCFVFDNSTGFEAKIDRVRGLWRECLSVCFGRNCFVAARHHSSR